MRPVANGATATGSVHRRPSEGAERLTHAGLFGRVVREQYQLLLLEEGGAFAAST